MRAYQEYIHELEALKGWLDVDLVHNCFLMGEEVGELFKAVRKVEHLFDQTADALGDPPAADVSDVRRAELVADVGDELVDVLNYLLAIANRLDIDVEAAFRAKNERNQGRSWG